LLHQIGYKEERPTAVKEHFSYESNVFVAEGEVRTKKGLKKNGYKA
jgi:hypothetical protein